MMRYFFVLSILLPFIASAQPYVKGRIFILGTPDPIPNVTVKSSSKGLFNISDQGGNYRIAAAIGDTLIFSSAGYNTDTLVVDATALELQHDMDLSPRVTTMESVEVDAMSRFIADSLQRRKDYAEMFNKKHPVKFMNEKREMDDPGFSISPIGYNSTIEKQKRRFKKTAS